MKIKILLGMFFSVAAMTLFGCGGGGGGAGAQPTVVSGTASKGQFSSGSVQIFAVDQTTGAKAATPLKTDVLSATGTYSVDISPYTGPVIVEVTGTYKDEVTGQQVTLAAPLRAAVANAAGSTSAMVTPLTELALKKAGTVLTPTVITKVNADIATLFKLDNILTTKPVDASDAAAASATAAQKNYALALATIAQIMKSGNSTLVQIMDGLAGEINDIKVPGSTATISTAASTSIKVAMFEFMASANNKTGLTDAATIPFSAGTPQIALLKISTSGTLPTGKSIGGIDFTMDLPSGVTVDGDAASSGAVEVSGVASTGTSISLATFTAPKLRTMLANANGFGTGEFVTVGCNLATGSTFTDAALAAALSAATLTVSDLTGTPITGLTLTGTVKVF